MNSKKTQKKKRNDNLKVEETIKKAMSKAREEIKYDANQTLNGFGNGGLDDWSQDYDQNKSHWSTLYDYISNGKRNENINNIVKQRKGEKEIVKSIIESGSSDVITKNPNIMRAFIMQNNILPRFNQKANLNDKR